MKASFVLLFSSPPQRHMPARERPPATPVTTDTADAGGLRSTSTTYTNDGGFSPVTGVSTAAGPSQTARHGYARQLTEATALQLAADPTTVNEGSTRQLSASLLNDDLTTTALLATAVGWGVQSGPITSVSTGGLATAGVVYQNTIATASALCSSLTGTLNLTVLNVSNDDIPGYAGDGLDDAWQVQYFVLGNSNASPLLDPDFDGQTNLFEFTAGIDPTSSVSRFLLSNAKLPGQPNQMNIVISPRLTDRTYTVKSSATPGPGAVWTPLTSFTITDNGSTRTITDTDATGARKFYRVEVSQP